jgi:glutathione S-transferase
MTLKSPAKMSETLQLLGFDCPFVERARLLLALKEQPYEYTNIRNFNPRPQWFLELNPQGKVPVLIHRGNAIYESAIINEYLEELYPNPPAFPATAAQRAFCRILIDYCGKGFVSSQFALLMNQDADKADKLMADALDSWRWLNDFLMLHNPDGSFAFAEFGMADISYIPFFSRYAAVRYYRHFELPASAGFSRVLRWFDACMTHPLTAAIAMPEEDIIKLYYSHSRGWGAGRLPPKGEHNSLDPEIPYAQRPIPPRPPKQYWQQSN